MVIWFYALVFCMGAVFGSFLNVLIDRLSTGRSFVKGRSYCEKCKKTLKTQDLIPLLSYIFLIGKCRYCKAKIPVRLFFVELLTGITFVAIFIQVLSVLISPFTAVFLIIIIISFIGIFFADIEYGLIPDKFTITALIFSFLYIWSINSNILEHVASGFGALAFFLILFLVTKGKGMGFGDVKISFVLGLLLGFPGILLSLYLAFLTGAVVSIILVICKIVPFRGATIPFGPFLVASALVTLFLGNQILVPFLMRFM
jgi:leader peptidase (prepilin peptidase)/N-methyltransferase